jgi:hypothetical protein
MSKLFNTIIGDATNPTLDVGEYAVIPHITNNGGWGAGFVMALEKRYPGVADAYCNWLEKQHLTMRLGQVQMLKVRRQPIFIVNMVAQDNMGVTKMRGCPPIRYSSLVKCMEKVAGLIDQQRQKLSDQHGIGSFDISIHCPMFGSGIAGGEWSVIEQLIKEIWISSNIPTTVYEFPAPAPVVPVKHDRPTNFIGQYAAESTDLNR